jgi:hypothetical protein
MTARQRKEAQRMRSRILVIGLGLLLGSAGVGWGGPVNCKQVNKYLELGRSVKDVAETMVISEDEVKKCQAEAGKPAGAQAEGAPAAGTQ